MSPPDMKKETDEALFSETEAMDVAGGWNKAEPTPPRNPSNNIRGKLSTNPMAETATPPRKSPRGIKTVLGLLSKKNPTAIWRNDAVIK
ncbi:hypothetical protein HRbin03_00373 [archaeon HR03]|nr:hypothetical protein HRbin03_00373 [archaeon HR03]